jgi:hypothetical protein
MGSYLKDSWARVGNSAARTSLVTRTTWSNSQINGQVISYSWTMIPCAATLPVLLVIAGVEKNPGPGI